MAQQLPVIMRGAALAGAALLLASCATMPDRRDAAAELAAMLDGKVAGKPQSCIRLDEARGTQIHDETLVYRSSRRLLYVNASRGCRSFDSDPIFINEVFGSQLCRGDIVRMVSRSGGIPGPFCVLGEFTPYRTPPRENVR